MKKFLFLLFFAIVFNSKIFANELRLNLVSGKVLHNRNHTDLSELPKNEKPLLLEYSDSNNYELISKAKSIASDPRNIALMVLEDGKVIFENYNFGTNKNTHFLSMSMAKSLTAYTIAQQLCDGRIRSLNDPIGNYAKDISFSFYDDVKIVNSLRMASGHARPTEHGHTITGQFNKLTKTNEIEMMDLFKVAHQTDKQGTKFRYNGHDTASIERVIAANANEPNMVKEFRRNIWNEIGAESDAFWLTDRNGIPLSFSGFYATMPDWARLALWSLDKVHEDSCIGDYMRQATVPQSKGVIENDAPQGRGFTGYGFQTWLRKGQYWWVGYGGQRVAIDPKRKRIIIAFSTKKYDGKLVKLMDSW